MLIRDTALGHSDGAFVMWQGKRVARSELVVIGDKLYCDVDRARESIVGRLWEMNRDSVNGDGYGDAFSEYLAMAGEFNRKYPERAIAMREVIPTREFRSKGQPHPLEALHGSTPA